MVVQLPFERLAVGVKSLQGLLAERFGLSAQRLEQMLRPGDCQRLGALLGICQSGHLLEQPLIAFVMG
ncbi:hypothetical protein D3C78_1873730 [compost metagenome]